MSRAVMTPAEAGELRSRLRGDVITPDDARYDETRAVYNAMIDKRPAAIARCVNNEDVASTVDFARETGLDLAIRGGGHNGAGLGTVDSGIVIDLSQMNTVFVDAPARMARVGGGALLKTVDAATHEHGLAAPFGIIGTTGVGGLTLGGGIGHLTRRYGLSIDNLVTAEVVLADGSVVTADTERNADLFWALRGGGGNFGVVTSFSFRLHPVSTVVAGPTLYTLDQSADVLRWYREFIPSAPEELNGFFAFITVPPGPMFPAELHLQKMAAIVWCYAGPEEGAEEAFRPVRDAITPALDGVGPMPYPALQSVFDELYPPGLQWYWRADFVDAIPEAAIDRHLEFARRLPTMHSTMHLYPVDGAVHRVAEYATAWSYRSSGWASVMVGVDPDPSKALRIRQWAVDYQQALHPFSAGGAYVNFMMEEGADRVRATYRGNYDRLVDVKRRYDPTNLFHVNQNIRPD